MIMILDNTNEMVSVLNKVDNFELILNGKTSKITKNEQKFEKIYEKLKEIFEKSKIMPAFSVSLHDLTKEDMRTHAWIKLNFTSTQSVNELAFEALTFRLDDCYGTNLIRQTDGKFQGRCIYLDFFEKTDLMKILD